MKLRLAQAAEVRLGRQRAPQFEQGENMVRYLRSANVMDGVLDLSDVKQMNFTPEEQETFELRHGDVLVTEGSGSRETVGTSAVWQGDLCAPVCFQNTLLRLRPRSGVTDGRFLAWWARHARSSGQIAAVSSGANILHLGSDGFKRLDLEVPPIHDQRRIADFLDERVARIDRIIAARRVQLKLEIEAAQRRVDTLFQRAVGEPLTRLGRLARVQTGLTVDSGRQTLADTVTRPYLRVANVQSGHVDLTEVKQVTVPADVAPRFALLKGDVLMTEGGDIDKLGRGTVWGGEIDGCLHQNHVFAVRSDQSRLLPQFLAQYTRTTDARRYFESTGARATNLASTSRSKVLDLPVPARSLSGQHDAVSEFNLAAQRAAAGRTALLAQVELLTEYKSSLITAAVTGELDVTTAGSGIPG